MFKVCYVLIPFSLRNLNIFLYIFFKISVVASIVSRFSLGILWGYTFAQSLNLNIFRYVCVGVVYSGADTKGAAHKKKYFFSRKKNIISENYCYAFEEILVYR